MAAVSSFVPHLLHGEGRTYLETNCWTDIVVELLHHRGLEPLAVLGSTLRSDFEGDQFTFAKPAQADMEDLLAVDVHEMQPGPSLPAQVADQLARGRSMVVELDAWWLPDTASTSYRSEHVKTSVAMEAIDLEARWLRYFHNAGLHELAGEDFDGAFRLGGGWSPDVLPPYCELVRFDLGEPLRGEELRAAARERTAQHLARRPADDPFARFGAQLERDLPGLLEGDAAAYHAYAFATVRMAGSAFEVAATHVRWLLGAEGEEAASHLDAVVEGCKVLSFRLARRRAFDPAPRVAALSEGWSAAMVVLDRALG